MLRIQRIHVENFRSYGGVELAFPHPRTLIIGQNNSGKTTLRDVVAWTLFGTCRGLDGAGRGLARLMKNPAQPIRVELDLDGIGRVIRTASLTDKAQTLEVGRVRHPGSDDEEFERITSGGVKDVEAWLLNKLQTSGELAAAVFDFGTVIGLAHAEAKNLLLRLLDVRVTIQVDGEAPETLALGELDGREATARENRTYAGRKLKELGVPKAPTAPTLKPVAVLRSEIASLKMEGTEAFAATQRHAGARTRLDNEIAALNREGQPIAARLAGVDLDGLRADLDRLKIDQAAIVIPDQADLLRTLSAAAESRGELANLVRVLEALQRHDPAKGCVLDASIPCKTPAGKFTGQIKLLDTRAAALRTDVAAADEAQITATSVRRAADDLAAKVASLTKRIELLAGDEQRHAAIVEALARLTAERDHMDRDQAAGGQTVTSNAGTIAELEQQIAQWARYDRQVADYEAAVADVEKAKDKLGRLDALCEILGPKGARVQALGEALEAFTAKVNKYLKQWDRVIAFELDPWRIIVNGRPLDVLSKSEQMRTGIALQLAVAAVSGLGFAFIDEAEVLDATNNGILARVVLSAAGGQIIVASTRDREYAAPVVDGLQVIRLELDARGSTTIVEDSAALAPV